MDLLNDGFPEDVFAALVTQDDPDDRIESLPDNGDAGTGHQLPGDDDGDGPGFCMVFIDVVATERDGRMSRSG